MCCRTSSARRVVICDGPAPALGPAAAGPSKRAAPLPPRNGGAAACPRLVSLVRVSGGGGDVEGWGGVKDSGGLPADSGSISDSNAGAACGGATGAAAESGRTRGTAPRNRPAIACKPETKASDDCCEVGVPSSQSVGSTPSEPCSRRPRTNGVAGMVLGYTAPSKPVSLPEPREGEILGACCHVVFCREPWPASNPRHFFSQTRSQNTATRSKGCSPRPPDKFSHAVCMGGGADTPELDLDGGCRWGCRAVTWLSLSRPGGACRWGCRASTCHGPGPRGGR